MKIQRVGIEDAGQASGVTIVVDVIRAFSVAAYALAGGAERLCCVGSIDDARALKAVTPHALLAGERGGRLIEGFDLNNSPARMAQADVRGRTIIQCTGAGTRGAVGAAHAPILLACSLVNARATARYARLTADERSLPVTLLPTGRGTPEQIEDDACCDYLEALLTDRPDADAALAAGLERIRASGRLNRFTEADPDFPAEDIPAFMAADRFDFAMVGTKRHLSNVTCVEIRPDSL